MPVPGVGGGGGNIHLFNSIEWEACGFGKGRWVLAQLHPHCRYSRAVAFSGLQSPPR